MSDLYGFVIYLESVQILCIFQVECVRVLWTKRAQHKTRSLSTHRGEKFPYPDIKNQSRSTQIFQSRRISLIEISLRDLIIKSSRDTHHHSASHILYERMKSSRDSLIKSSRDVSSYSHIHRHLDEIMLSYVHTHRD